ncbi:helix-turn-helix domain-containing protein [Spongiimicrobium salis]|uniref:helix-turn-helix domain-containing protein n=1 Tax=Spongiimicrobium salis TaxID=1667022 RepID=UPI00374CCCB4
MDKMQSNISNNVSDLNLLKKKLGGTLIRKDYVSYLILPSTVGTGQIHFLELQEGVKVFNFDVKLIKEIEIEIGAFSAEALQFLYCLEGSCHHQFNIEGSLNTIGRFQTAVAHSTMGISSKIRMTPGERLILNIITVSKPLYFKKFHEESNLFGQQFQKLLEDLGCRSGYFHLGGSSLRIAEELKSKITSYDDNALVREFSDKGHYYIILAKQIEQFCSELTDNSKPSRFLEKELQCLNDIGEYIKEFPGEQYSVRTLRDKTGMSPAKLQDGFKFVFGRTVSDFVRNVRLEKAEELIRTTDMNISEIVYSVGLTSRSYFCKIFKRKYDCNPRDYKNKIYSSEKKRLDK